MKDTPPEIEEKYRKASVLAENPRATEAEIRQALFLRFYGNDFDSATREKILRALGNPVDPGGK